MAYTLKYCCQNQSSKLPQMRTAEQVTVYFPQAVQISQKLNRKIKYLKSQQDI